MPTQFIKLKNGNFKKVDLLKIYMKALVESAIEIQETYIKFCVKHNKEIQPMPEKQKNFLIAYKTTLAISLKYDFDKDSIVKALRRLQTPDSVSYSYSTN